MIARIEGKLLKLTENSALIEVGSLTYEVMLPGYCVESISGKVGSDILLCTMEYYEGTPGGGNLIPRMVGFLNSREREFFGKYTSVKGMGVKKALRSLSIPIATLASAIEQGDEKTLLMLPGVGKRMSQQIIASLRGKLEDFAAGAEIARPAGTEFTAFQAEALEILIAWGERRNEAMEMIDLACKKHPDIKTAEALVPLVYRLKQGIEA
jgi:Holliday junction DNA helicase RuvA